MRIAIVLVTILLAACTSGANEAELIATAKKSAADQIGIPSTATFRNVRLSDVDGADLIGTVCGEVSGQSVDGLAIGFTRFIYAPSIEQAVVAFDPRAYVEGASNDKRVKEFRAAFEEMWKQSCV